MRRDCRLEDATAGEIVRLWLFFFWLLFSWVDMREMGKYNCHQLKDDKIFGINLQFSLPKSCGCHYTDEMRPILP